MRKEFGSGRDSRWSWYEMTDSGLVGYVNTFELRLTCLLVVEIVESELKWVLFIEMKHSFVFDGLNLRSNFLLIVFLLNMLFFC